MSQVVSSREITFFVPSKPAPQGNHRISATGHLYEQSSSQLQAWRNAISFVAGLACRHEPFFGALDVEITFYLPAPKRALRTRPSVRPDADKLARAALDALTAAGVWVDDAQVVDLCVHKRYAGPQGPGASFTIKEAEG